MIKECLQEYSVQEIINKVHTFLLFLIDFSNILKYDVNIYLSFLLNYCRINGWEFCCKWDSSISSNELFWLKRITSIMYTILFFLILFIVYISFIIEYDVDFFNFLIFLSLLQHRTNEWYCNCKWDLLKCFKELCWLKWASKWWRK